MRAMIHFLSWSYDYVQDVRAVAMGTTDRDVIIQPRLISFKLAPFSPDSNLTQAADSQ